MLIYKDVWLVKKVILLRVWSVRSPWCYVGARRYQVRSSHWPPCVRS